MGANLDNHLICIAEYYKIKMPALKQTGIDIENI